MLQSMHLVNERATPCLTVTDFFNIFNEEMHSLYLLAFLLTADHDKAEECLVSAMGDCLEGVGVFTDWARSWTRGAVLTRAIQMVMPTPEHADSVPLISLERSHTPAEDNPFAAILLLDAFERFVFVMSILEGQSDEKCAILLKCPRRDVTIARVLALKRQLGTAALAEEAPRS